MPESKMRDRPPELPLQPRWITPRRQPSGNGSEDPDAVGDQLEDRAHIRREVAVEKHRLIPAVAAYRMTVSPPAASILGPVQPTDGRDVAMSWSAPREKGQVRDTRGRRKSGDGLSAPAMDQHL